MSIIRNDGSVTYVWVVVGTFTREERVMSDVYSLESYAVVYNVETDDFETVHVGGEFCNNPGTVTVDAPSHIMDLRQEREGAKVKLAALAAAQNAREARAESARRWVLAPKKGRQVRVVSGRKVPKGTEGEVFWQGEGRLGVKDANGNAHWVDERHCVAIWGDFPLGGEPSCGWIHFKEHVVFHNERVRLSRPNVNKGDRVVLESGAAGLVFWRRDEKIGVALSEEKDAQGNYTQKAWASLGDVVEMNGVGSRNLVEEIPMPFSLIRSVRDGKAFDSEGELLMELEQEALLAVKDLAPTLISVD